MVATIILTKKNSHNAKDLHEYMRVWFKILLGCIHRRPPTNSADFINTDQKYMLYYNATDKKMNLSSIMIKYLRDMVRETRNKGKKI